MYGSLFYVLPILAVIAKTVFRAVLPLLIGCMIAYVVNILMCFYEKGYAKICRMAAIAPLQRPLCMTLSYLSLVLVILILWWMIVPQLLSCIRIIATDFPPLVCKSSAQCTHTCFDKTHSNFLLYVLFV